MSEAKKTEIIRPFNNSIFQEEDKNVNEEEEDDSKHKQENKQIEQDIK